MATVTAECVHHWVIEQAAGETSPGRCRHCGATRDFPNAITTDTWRTFVRPPKRRGRPAAKPPAGSAVNEPGITAPAPAPVPAEKPAARRGPRTIYPFSTEDDALFGGYDSRPETVDRIQKALESRWGRPVPRYMVTHRARRLGLVRRRRTWTEEDLERLGNLYGRVPDSVLARRLERTEVAITLAAKRKLNINRKNGFYTAREVARLLGVSCAKTVVGWLNNGWLEGHRSPVACGPTTMWCFSEEAVVEALRRRPWLVNISRMQEHFFRSVVSEERERDRWYTPAQAAPLLGIKDFNAVHRYIYRGWLKAEKKPGGPHQGVWIIRRSTINAFLAADPRPGHRKAAVGRFRRDRLLAGGRAVRVETSWQLLCPRCRAAVVVRTDPSLAGAQVAQLFRDIHAKGDCAHGAECSLQKERRTGCMTTQ